MSTTPISSSSTEHRSNDSVTKPKSGKMIKFADQDLKFNYINSKKNRNGNGTLYSSSLSVPGTLNPNHSRHQVRRISSWGNSLKSKFKEQNKMLQQLPLPSNKSSNKRLSVSLIPRRFSSSSSLTTISGSRSNKSPTIDSFPSYKSNDELSPIHSASYNPMPTPQQSHHDLSVESIIEEGVPITNSEITTPKRVTSAASLASDKSSLTRSLSKIRRGARSILLLDPQSASVMSRDISPTREAENTFNFNSLHSSSSLNFNSKAISPHNIKFTFSDENNDSSASTIDTSPRIRAGSLLTPTSPFINSSKRPGYRRSASYSDRQQQKPLELELSIQGSHTQIDTTGINHHAENETTTTTTTTPTTSTTRATTPITSPIGIRFGTPDKTPMRNSRPAMDITRQRSKTLDALENPNNQQETGIFSSITNFMKTKKSSSSNLADLESCIISPGHSRSASVTKLEEISKKDILPYNSDDDPSEYLDRLLSQYPLTSIASILAIEDREFLKKVFRVYLKKFFDFSNEPLDLALRQFLMINDLPKETQQIDRVIYEFGNHYASQHSDVGQNSDFYYILTYSLIMLHTDKFNPNNKRKMTRWEFIENLKATLQEHNDLQSNELTKLISKDILGYYYDNITYTPFIKMLPEQSVDVLAALTDEDEVMPYPLSSVLTAANINVSSQPLTRKRSTSTFNLWGSSLPLDPYENIINDTCNDLRLDMKCNTHNPFSSTFIEDTSEGSKNKLLEQTGIEDDASIIPTEEYITYETELSSEELDLRTLQSIHTNLIGDQTSMVLKIPKAKASFLLDKNTSIEDYSSEGKDGEEFYVTRVFKIGMISKQESKILSNVKSWKKYFCVLTAVGLLFYKNIAIFKMKYITDSEQEKKTIVLEEKINNTTTPSLLESYDPTFMIPKGLFATRMKKNVDLDVMINSAIDYNNNRSSVLVPKKLETRTFFIYGRNSKEVFLVDNKYELKSWVTVINYLSALDPIKFKISKLFLFDEYDATQDVYNEIIALGKHNIDDHLAKLKDEIKNSSKLLQEYLNTVNRLNLLTPFSLKTREMILSSFKILNIKLEWVWYELSKNNIFKMVLEELVKEKAVATDINNSDVISTHTSISKRSMLSRKSYTSTNGTGLTTPKYSGEVSEVETATSEELTPNDEIPQLRTDKTNVADDKQLEEMNLFGNEDIADDADEEGTSNDEFSSAFDLTIA